MSQEKVDKYKEEKKNRKKTMKINKIKKALAVFVVSLGVGALIGIPLGKHIYKVQKEEAEKHRTIPSSEFEAWFDKKWNDEYSSISGNQDVQDILNQLNSATYTDATPDDSSEE